MAEWGELRQSMPDVAELHFRNCQIKFRVLHLSRGQHTLHVLQQIAQARKLGQRYVFGSECRINIQRDNVFLGDQFFQRIA